MRNTPRGGGGQEIKVKNKSCGNTTAINLTVPGFCERCAFKTDILTLTKLL